MKICHGCSTQLAKASRRARVVERLSGRQLKNKSRSVGAQKGGEALTIFIDEKDKTGAKAVTLKDLKQEIDGVDDDAIVEFRVKEPPGKKNFDVTHALVGGKVRPLKAGGLQTLTVHGVARSIRGWRVDLVLCLRPYRRHLNSDLVQSGQWGNVGKSCDPTSRTATRRARSRRPKN